MHREVSSVVCPWHWLPRAPSSHRDSPLIPVGLLDSLGWPMSDPLLSKASLDFGMSYSVVSESQIHGEWRADRLHIESKWLSGLGGKPLAGF